MNAIRIEPILSVKGHPTSDQLELVVTATDVGIAAKGVHQTGDLVAIIPAGVALTRWQQDYLNAPAITIESICYPVTKAIDESWRELFGEEAWMHVIEVDKATLGVGGFVVREGDDLNTYLSMRGSPA